PHHLQPADVNRYLWGAFTALEKPPESPDLKLSDGDWPMPGKNLSREALRKKIQGKVKAVEGDLFATGEVYKAKKFVFEGKATCGLCHQYERDPTSAEPLKIRLPNVPQAWYPHSKFNHRAHRAMDCISCHTKAEESKVSRDVLI